MSGIPTVTITVTGTTVEPASAEDATAGLHMLYVQGVKGEQRYQWVIFPPPVTTLDVQDVPGHPVLLLQRLQEFSGNRSKWFHHKYVSHGDVATVMGTRDSEGWVLSDPIVVPLEVDDYQAAWKGDTPHKALRAVDRAIKPFGLSVK